MTQFSFESCVFLYHKKYCKGLGGHIGNEIMI